MVSELSWRINNKSSNKHFYSDSASADHHGVFTCAATTTYKDKEYGTTTATIDVNVESKSWINAVN